MSAEQVALIDGENPPEVRPTNPANRTHADPMVRMAAMANDFLVHRVAVRRVGRAVDIVLPTEAVADPLAEEDLIQMLSPAVNGNVDVKEQGVHVQYLNADQRLVLPHYISARALEVESIAKVAAAYKGIEAMVGASRTTIERVIAAVADGTEEKDPEAKLIIERTPIEQRSSITLSQARAFVGTGARASFRLVAGVGDGATPEEREEIVDMVRVNVPSISDAAVFTPFSFPRAAPLDFVAIRFAHFVGLNADPRDCTALSWAGMRLADDAFHGAEPLPLSRFRSKLHPFTVSSIAALNYARMKEIPLLAWTRAYLTSAGVLADANSKVHSEVAFTGTRASKSVVKKLSEYHDRDSQRVLLAAYSLGAMFGLEHLARDHTYREGDEVLARVNKAYENALKTVLTGDEPTTLAANRHETHRLVCHPFGISQCYTLALWGAHHHRIAEALQIRENVCPPALNRVSLAVGVFKQVCSLPVGVIVRDIFAADHRMAEEYMKRLGNRRSAHSGLAHLYGWAAYEKVDQRVLDAVNRMMPMLAGYAEAFHTTDPKTGAAHLSGAALAASIGNIKRDNGALVQLFSGLFTKYIELSKEQGLEQFLINQRNAIRLAMSGAEEEKGAGYVVVSQEE